MTLSPLAPALRLLLGLVATFALAACSQGNAESPGVDMGDPERGAQLIEEIGCGSCHQIPGIREADGLVGPPLDHMANRGYLAGVLRNTPDNMVRWLMAPQEVVPGNAMPDMGLSTEQARDVTAYLYTLE